MKVKLFALIITIFVFTSMESFAQKGTLKGVVKDNSGPLIGASVIVKGTPFGASTSLDGTYEISLQPGTYTIEVSYIGYSASKSETTVRANETTSLDFTLEEGITIDEVFVLGSRSDPRTQLETTVPIDVISAKEIANSSYGNLTHTLQYTAPSFHSTPQTISDGTDHIDPATLRGLGPDQVLVLVNGKRRHTSSLVNVNGTVGRGTVGTDLNAIPSAAIKKIEILRDGAAAQYGSDAIAGVINIVLKDNIEEASVRLRSGITSEGDGEEYQASTNFGFKLGDKGGYVNGTFDFLYRDATNRSGDYTGGVFGDSITIDGVLYSDNNEDQLNEFFAQTPFDERKVMQVGNSAGRNAGAVFNAGLPLENGGELYGNLMFNYRNGISRGFYRFPALRDRVVPELHPFGFSPEIHSDILDNAFTVGIKGAIGDWKADLSQTRGENSFDFTIKNSNNASLGQASPTSAFAGGLNYSQNTTNFDLSRKVMAGIPINVAFGGEFRLENYQLRPGEEASYVDGSDTNSNGAAGSAGIQVFPGFQPQNALDKNRSSASAYADFELDITENLLLALAGRFESYTDFGETFNYKIAARYKFSKNLSLRGAISTGFRAPSLHQIYFSSLSTQFITVNGQLEPVQVGTFNNESSVAKAFGIDPLDAETSTNISAGITFRPAKNFSISTDYYRIKIDDRIVLSGRFSPTDTLAGGVVAGDLLTPLGAGAAQFFTNAVSTTTQGVDIVANYRHWFNDDKKLTLTLAANFTDTEVEKDAGGTPVINSSDLLVGNENTLFNREEVSRLEVAQPNMKIAFSANLEMKRFNVILRATHFGEVLYIHPTDPTLDEDFSAKIVPDIEIGYQVNKFLKWDIGAQNVTNTFPDEHVNPANISSGRFVYSRRVQQFGVRGRFVYSKLTFDF